MKKLLSLIVAIVLVVGLISGCTTTEPNDTTSPDVTTQTPTESSAPEETQDQNEYPPVDYSGEPVYGVSPTGEKAGSIADVQLTEEEKEEIRAGNYTAAFCYHQLDNQVNISKYDATVRVLEDLNIKVLSTTDAQSDADKLVNDLETTLALAPDILFSMPYDPDVTAATYRKFVEAGTKIVFMENIPTGFTEDMYVTMTNSDSYGNGKYAADIMAEKLGYEGTVAMVFYDADFFTTNERDRAFREAMAETYPNIEIVEEYGFTSIDVVGASADALFAQYPDIDGVYASWDIPAEDVMASAKANNREDVVITCIDLGDNAATIIARDGMIKGLGAPKAAETGEIEGLAAGCALIGKEIPKYIISASQAVSRENILDVYQVCYQIDTPDIVVEAYDSVE